MAVPNPLLAAFRLMRSLHVIGSQNRIRHRQPERVVGHPNVPFALLEQELCASGANWPTFWIRVYAVVAFGEVCRTGPATARGAAALVPAVTAINRPTVNRTLPQL